MSSVIFEISKIQSFVMVREEEATDQAEVKMFAERHHESISLSGRPPLHPAKVWNFQTFQNYPDRMTIDSRGNMIFFG
jgi:hypothetical protein